MVTKRARTHSSAAFSNLQRSTLRRYRLMKQPDAPIKCEPFWKYRFKSVLAGFRERSRQRCHPKVCNAVTNQGCPVIEADGFTAQSWPTGAVMLAVSVTDWLTEDGLGLAVSTVAGSTSSPNNAVTPPPPATTRSGRPPLISVYTGHSMPPGVR